MRQEDEKKDGRLSGAMRIFEALSSVDEELLERSEAAPKVVPFWKYAKVMAACACLVLLGTAAYAGSNLFSAKNSTSSDCTAPAAAEQRSVDMASDAAGVDDTAGGAAAEEAAAEEAVAEEAAAEGAAPEAEQEKAVLTENLQNSAAGESDTGKMTDSQMTQNTSEWQTEKDKVAESVQEGGPVYDGDSFSVMPEALDEETIRATQELGAYIPTALPTGYVYESGYRTGGADAAESVSVLWKNGMDTIHISVSRYEESEEMQERLADVSKPETYNVHLYEIPYCDSVPVEYYRTFDYPVFRESDFSSEIVEMRMKSVSDSGDTDTPRGNFAVLYDSGILVEFSGDGDAGSIWKLFLSIEP